MYRYWFLFGTNDRIDFSLELGLWDIIILLFETFKKNKKGKKEKERNKNNRKFEIRKEKCPKCPKCPKNHECIDHEV